jgi:hypothetical protein
MNTEPFEAGPPDVAHLPRQGEHASPIPTGGPASEGAPMSEQGYVKTFRKMLDWQFYTDVPGLVS